MFDDHVVYMDVPRTSELNTDASKGRFCPPKKQAHKKKVSEALYACTPWTPEKLLVTMLVYLSALVPQEDTRIYFTDSNNRGAASASSSGERFSTDDWRASMSSSPCAQIIRTRLLVCKSS
ncbi:hypothetical protein BaRGS_00024869 [Batillaria attramentaria]|uniref:Uncharacterized protein n=1 Tax=Batillaria attramentaria TaxID=370345 RepID=A0ABD0K9V1_9CAEN